MRLNYFDYFRAIAIVLIVAGHSFTPWAIDSLPEMVIANLISGGTSLFVFISGFFFHHVFYRKFNYKNFIIKKSKKIFLPYVISSIIGFSLIVVYLNTPHPMLTNELSSSYDICILFFQYLLTGRTLTAYWYIPFIMIIFIISPVFIKYISLSIQKQIYIFILLLSISMLVHRPEFNISPLHSVIYFSPIYLLGIIFSLKQTEILKYINNKSFLLASLVLVTSLAQVIIYDSYGSYHKEEIFSYNGIDIIIIQKIFMIFFFLSVLIKIDHKEIPFLKYIASISFAIYFLHPYILFFLSYFTVIKYIYFLPGLAIFFIKTFFTIVISIVAAMLLKKVLHKKSAYIIGW